MNGPTGSVDDRIRHGFRLCLVREGKDTEVQVLKLFDGQRLANQLNPKASQDLLAGFNFTAPEGIRTEEFTAWYAVATALLNLDETITKN